MEMTQALSITGGNVMVKVSPSSVSKFVGQKKSNLISLEKIGFNIKIVQDKALAAYEIKVIPCY